ncbi:methylenetetrahydromethanopterin dehydrogenase, partial [Candidatus Thorarchaeota archaeon]
REFLDATEMVIFNSDIMKILAICGVVRGVHSEIDGIVESIRRGESIIMPRIVMDTNTSLEYAQLHNSYSNAKAIAALKMAEQAAQLTSAACFRVSDPDEYIALAAAAHEMVRKAAKLADEIREIEKSIDAVQRTPHSNDGSILSKSSLDEKPK